jgi:sulfur-oxidizing protein SoxB
MNDSHAYFDLHQEMFREGDHAVYRKAGGYARIAALVKQIRGNSIDFY